MQLKDLPTGSTTSPAKALLLALPFNVPIAALLAWYASGPWQMATLLSLLACAAAAIDYKIRGEGAALTIALALICQPAIFIASLAGHPWQVDMHIYFFMVMAALSFLNSVTPLIAAAGFVAVHHLGLNFAFPALIYPGGSDLARSMLHAVILILETAALIAIVQSRQKQEAGMSAQTQAAAASASLAEEARQSASTIEASANEHRAAMMGVLRSEFGSVVEAASEGDFSKRISASMDDADLARLVSSTNALINTVDNGIGATRAAIEGLAARDLRAKMEGEFHGEFADLQRDVNHTMDLLSGMVADLRDQNSDLHGLSVTLNSEATDLLSRVQAQMSVLEEAGQLNAQMVETAQTNVAAAEDVAGSSRHAAQRTEEISTTIRSGSEAMGQISKGTEQMASIVGVIESIAMQTNLLALNAAVEAARAGEAGKGFAVVANEVRDLAQRATTASSEIKELIQTNEERVKRGVSLIDSADGQLSDIVEAVKSIQDAMNRIHGTSEEQMSGIDRSRDGLTRIQNAAEAALNTAERNRQQADQMSQKSGRMLDALAQFTLGSGRTSERTASKARAA